MGSAVTIILTFDVFLLSFLAIYGVGSGALDLSTTLDAINSPWPGLNRFCQQTDLSCNVARLADIIYLPATFFFKLGAVLYLGYQLTTALGAVANLPIIGPFVVLAQIILILFAWSQIRGSPHPM